MLKKLNEARNKWKRLIKPESERAKRNINRVSHKEEKNSKKQEKR